MRSLTRCMTIVSLVCLSGCLTAPAAHRGAGENPSKLTVDDLRGETTVTTLFEFIRRERPQWLTKRGNATMIQGQTDIVVYRDGIRVGGPAALQDISLAIVVSAEYLSGPDAGTRFGLNHQHGAILVITRR